MRTQIGRRALLCLNKESLNDAFWNLIRAFPEVVAPGSSHVFESFEADWALWVLDEV